MKQYTENDIQRFYNLVAVSTPDDCWRWIGSRNGRGYGKFWFDGKEMSAHRFAWWISTGVRPGDLFVCHKCDNPGCVNPKHLWMGTQYDNMQDSIKKGRFASHIGERNNRVKLTEDNVREIRYRYKARGIGQCQLAIEYGVSQSAISLVISRDNWKHI